MPIKFKFVRRVGNYLVNKHKMLYKLVVNIITRKNQWKYFIAADITYREPTNIIVLARDEKSGEYHMAFMKNIDKNANLQEIRYAIGDLARKYGISDRKDVYLDSYSGVSRESFFDYENSAFASFEKFNPKSTKPTKNRNSGVRKHNGH